MHRRSRQGIRDTRCNSNANPRSTFAPTLGATTYPLEHQQGENIGCADLFCLRKSSPHCPGGHSVPTQGVGTLFTMSGQDLALLRALLLQQSRTHQIFDQLAFQTPASQNKVITEDQYPVLHSITLCSAIRKQGQRHPSPGGRPQIRPLTLSFPFLLSTSRVSSSARSFSSSASRRFVFARLTRGLLSLPS